MPRAEDGPTQAGQAGAHLAIVVAAFLFGTTFVLVKDAVADVEPVPFLAVRFMVGALVMWPFMRGRPSQHGIGAAGLWCGLSLAAGYLLQTIGLQYTTPSVSAFITYLLVVIVPLLSLVTLRRAPLPATVAGVVVATAGLVLLTGGADGVGFGRGELLTLGCAVSFAVHVVLLAAYAPRMDSVRLNALQLLVVGALCLVPGYFMGGYDFTARAWLAALYTGAAVSGGALFLQVRGQRRLGPSRTALILLLEPVFAAALGAATGDRLGLVGWAGAALIMAGVALAEVAPILTARSTVSLR